MNNSNQLINTPDIHSYYDPQCLSDRSNDQHYSFLLYTCSRLGTEFDIYVNKYKVKIVNEYYSINSSLNSGTLQFVVIDPSIKRRRKIHSCYWKQNGDENRVNVNLPSGLIVSKRNFTMMNSDISERYKLWEYALFQSEMGPQTQYPLILRHVLKDVSNTLKYFTAPFTVSIKSKNLNHFNSVTNFQIKVGDYNMVESLYTFATTSKMILPHHQIQVDQDILNLQEPQNKINYLFDIDSSIAIE